MQGRTEEWMAADSSATADTRANNNSCNSSFYPTLRVWALSAGVCSTAIIEPEGVGGSCCLRKGERSDGGRVGRTKSQACNPACPIPQVLKSAERTVSCASAMSKQQTAQRRAIWHLLHALQRGQRACIGKACVLPAEDTTCASASLSVSAC
jgi:hypothetical protein